MAKRPRHRHRQLGSTTLDPQAVATIKDFLGLLDQLELSGNISSYDVVVDRDTTRDINADPTNKLIIIGADRLLNPLMLSTAALGSVLTSTVADSNLMQRLAAARQAGYPGLFDSTLGTVSQVRDRFKTLAGLGMSKKMKIAIGVGVGLAAAAGIGGTIYYVRRHHAHGLRG